MAPSRSPPTLAERVDLARPWLGRSLVPDAAFERVRDASAGFGPGWTWGTIEARLGAGSGQVDLLACATDWDGDRELLAAAPAREALADVQPLLDAWLDREHVIGSRMPLLWVEVDLPVGGVARRPFSHLRVAHHSPTAGFLAGRVPDEDLPFIETGLELMLGRPAPRGQLGVLDRCLRAIPSGACVMHINVTPPRDSHELRFDMSFPREAVRPFLQRVGWPGDLAALDPIWALWEDQPGRVGVALEIDEDVTAKVAFEHFRIGGAHVNDAWPRFIARLVEAGYADLEKAMDAMLWCGIGDARDLATGRVSRVTRQLDVKIVVEADGRTGSKAYLMWTTEAAGEG